MYDVTLVYPEMDETLWDFVTNRVPRIIVRARRIEIPDEFRTAAATEPGPARDRFKAWIEELSSAISSKASSFTPSRESRRSAAIAAENRRAEEGLPPRSRLLRKPPADRGEKALIRE
jgi:hypothetical protein